MEELIGLVKESWSTWKRNWMLALFLCSLGISSLVLVIVAPPFGPLSGLTTEVDYSFQGNIAVNLTLSEPIATQPLGHCGWIAIYLYSPDHQQEAPVTLVLRNSMGDLIAMLTNRTSNQMIPPGGSVPQSARFQVLADEYILEVYRESADTFFGCYVEAYSLTVYGVLGFLKFVGNLFSIFLCVLVFGIGLWFAWRVKIQTKTMI